MRKLRILAAAALVLIILFSSSCSSANDFDHQLNAITKPYRFSFVRWEFDTFVEKARHYFARKEKNPPTDAEITNQYIDLSNRINDLKGQQNSANLLTVQAQIDGLQTQQDKITPTVEDIIKKQTTQVLNDMGIYQPWFKYIPWKFTFPPPDFKLIVPPHLLVISERDKIDRKTDITLISGITLEQEIKLESDVDKLNVSSLVVDLGGIGTYPSIVSSDSPFTYIIETCAHEWAHAYLTFTPLGARYALNTLGWTHNDDISTMNESTADIIGREVGAAVVKKYYPQFQTNDQPAPDISPSAPAPLPQPVFNFNLEMRGIRQQVDTYLAAGQIDTAEQYMQQKQVYLAANGYYIRKLNQAYFAFYGTYADSPAYESPIGTKIKQLRARSSSLQNFLKTMSAMTGVKNLDSALK